MKNRSTVTPEFHSAPPPPPPPLHPRRMVVWVGAALIVALVFGLIAVTLYAFAQLPTPTPDFFLPTLTPTLPVSEAVSTTPPPTLTPTRRALTLTPTVPASPMPAEQTVLVLNIINVSTIEVAVDGNRRLVYLIGLGAPPTNDTCFNTGRRASERLMLNRTVRLVKDVTEVDEIGRMPRYVYVDDELINATLLQEGYARFISSRNDHQFDLLLEAAANVALENGRGCYAGTSEVETALTPISGTAESECNRYFTCAQLGTQLNYDEYIAACPGEVVVFDAGGDGIGCNQRADWGYPPD